MSRGVEILPPRLIHLAEQSEMGLLPNESGLSLPANHTYNTRISRPFAATLPHRLIVHPPCLSFAGPATPVTRPLLSSCTFPLRHHQKILLPPLLVHPLALSFDFHFPIFTSFKLIYIPLKGGRHHP
jgi:hypothetical protein